MDYPTLPPSEPGERRGNDDDGHVPGLVLVFGSGTRWAEVIRLQSGVLELGRGEGGAGKLADGRVSRRHALVEHDGDHFRVTDLGSQNGTSADGQPLPPQTPTALQRLLRVGDSLLMPLADVRPLERHPVRRVDGMIRGAAMQLLLEEAAHAARSGGTLHIRGESGTGKEGVAQVFHRTAAREGGQLVAVNCASIPPNLAERLLFGAKRGAYSGADSDAPGYVQEADGGTLFLDEVAELDLAVQAKLLRVLEAKELLPLGASKPRKVDFQFCSATHKDLRALVAAGRLREDLYFRIGRPALTLPPLRNRPEEIPALVGDELSRATPPASAHVSLVEQCLLRAWPGNVRELLAEVRAAAQAATRDGGRVLAQHLAPLAGSAFGGTGATTATGAAFPAGELAGAPTATPTPRKRMPQVDDDWRRRIQDALRVNGGNIAATARALGLHRTQLRRLLERHQIDVADTGPDDDSVDD
ncbi:MAG TPA: sigma 54-interacting transcriptional regulator [Polyangia bacterium]|nr:sigma 54-interacting transcriptional regulator [Polyangia bacterium]